MNTQEMVRDFSKGLLVWYKFKNDSDILLVFNEQADSAISEFLSEQTGKGVFCTAAVNDILSYQKEKNIKYDYIIAIDILEIMQSPENLLSKFKALLKPDGKLLLGAENRLAIKYFCGDRDPYTKHNFDGIENYRRLTQADKKDITGRCYSKAELKEMLSEAGFKNNKFYSVMPNLNEAQLIYAESYTPVEELAMRYFPLYNYPDSVFLNEEFLYTDLVKNGMFHIMANTFFIECSLSGEFDSTLHSTVSMDRGFENALVTSVCEDDGVRKVYKKAVYSEGVKKLRILQDNLADLHKRGINVVESHIAGELLVMPYIDKPVAMNALKDIAKRDKNEFVHAIDTMYDLIIMSSEHTDIISEKDKNSANGRDLGIILSKGYIDMVPLNCFYDESIENPRDRFIYYDQEFYWENCPAKAILYRSISIIYDGTDREFEELIAKKVLLERYGLNECSDIWERMSSRFTTVLRNQKQLKQYYYNKKCDARTLYTNREKINYNSKDYRKIFIDIFEGLDEAELNGIDKKIILFGSGIFTSRFLAQFANDFKIYSIIDNDKEKWGTKMEDIPINSPEIIKAIKPEELHVIICIKNYYGVVNQLKNMGVNDYHIFDPGNDYPNKRRVNALKHIDSMKEKGINGDGSNACTSDKSDKPYNIGYIAGVFDLFHIGHLNMFKRAKEMCNYLIVGVVSDEGVRLNKQAEPFVPFEERIELVRSCRYVDEAVKLPLNFAGTQDMFRVYHFDVQFSGSDYEYDPVWLAEKEFLEKNGSTMLFFPYTQSTSSTKLKSLINQRLI